MGRAILFIIVYCGFSTLSILTDRFYHAGVGVFRNWKLSGFGTENYRFSKIFQFERTNQIFGVEGVTWAVSVLFFSEIISSFLRSRSSHHLLTYFEHGECSRAHATVPFLSSVWRHCRSCIHHKQLKATELYQTSLGGKSPQDQPNGLVIDTWGKRNVAAFLHIVLQH